MIHRRPFRLASPRSPGPVSRQRPDPATLAWLAAFALALACSSMPVGAAEARAPSAAELAWLNRITYGLDSATLERYQALGRGRFLSEQLQGRDETLPTPVREQIDALEIVRVPQTQLERTTFAEGERIRALDDEQARREATDARNRHRAELAQQARERNLLRAVHSPSQLREQMTAFWLNHFSVYGARSDVGLYVADYSERAIRPNALGKFRDLLLASLKHPAMLRYLDNASNAKGRLNENYARELMELHTLGADAGYSQQDVESLARILTGAGINLREETPDLPPGLQAAYHREGSFEFNPARHEPGDKTLLGRTVAGGGVDEIERAVDVIAAHPACARFISRKLAAHFLGEDPPPALAERMSGRFERSDGDIAAVLELLFESDELLEAPPMRFKDPQRFVISALRLAYDGRAVANVRPAMEWLRQLGQSPFNRTTPEGYPLQDTAWTGSGQLVQRFIIARAIGRGQPDLSRPRSGEARGTGEAPPLDSSLFHAAIAPTLSQATLDTLERASNREEWNTLLLASPDFNRY